MDFDCLVRHKSVLHIFHILYSEEELRVYTLDTGISEEKLCVSSLLVCGIQSFFAGIALANSAARAARFLAKYSAGCWRNTLEHGCSANVL